MSEAFPRNLFVLSVILIVVWFYLGQVTKVHLTKSPVPNRQVAMVENQKMIASELEHLSKDLKKIQAPMHTGKVQQADDQKAEEERQKAIQQAEAANRTGQALAADSDSYQKFNEYLLEQQKETENKKMKPAPIIISALFGLCSLYIIVSKKYNDEATKWACGTAGIIMGF